MSAKERMEAVPMAVRNLSLDMFVPALLVLSLKETTEHVQVTLLC